MPVAQSAVSLRMVPYLAVASLVVAGWPLHALAATIELSGTSNADVIDVSTSTTPYAIFGLAGADQLTGSSADDFIDGSSGNDIIDGRGGSDILIGGGGNDTIYGGDGDDEIRVSGASAWDTIDGGAGNDRLVGSSGDDTIGLRSLAGVERIDGGGGHDKIVLAGGASSTLNLSEVTVTGIELIEGSASADTIIGSSADDSIVGGRGNDRIAGRGGNDVVTYPDAYSHYAVIPNADGSLTITDPAVGGTGTDTIFSVESVRFADGVFRDGAFTPDSTPGTDALLDRIAAAPAGSWLRINQNRFQDVWPAPARQPATPSYLNPAKVIYCWSSMAWDSNRNQLIFWGGGHANYSGNEVYTFDAINFVWKRASLPSDVVDLLGDGQYFAVDGARNAPTSSHTYDNQEFLPNIDRFITFGGAKFNARQQFVLEDGTTRTGPYLWDPSRAGANSVGGTAGSQVSPDLYPSVIGARMWQDRDTIVNRGIASVRPSGDWVNATSAYLRFGGKDAILITEAPRTQARLFLYVINDVADPALDTWTLVGTDTLGYANQGAGAYDPVRKLFARTAKTTVGWRLVVWDLTNPGATNRSFAVLPQSVDGALAISEFHGMDFDTQRGEFALWDGGSQVWYVRPPLDVRNGTWTATPALTHPTTEMPSQQDGNLLVYGKVKPNLGVLGKWKYARDYGVFFGVIDSVNGDVWVFKPPGWKAPAD